QYVKFILFPYTTLFRSDNAVYWYIGFLVALSISMVLLVKATQELPIGTAYAVWTGIGAVGTVLLGILVFKEPAEFWRLFFITTRSEEHTSELQSRENLV